MLYDRPYMRDNGPLQCWWHSATICLIIANTAIYLFQHINGFYLHWDLTQYLALSTEGMRHGYIWQLLTFQFLHAGGWHLVFNLLALYWFGRPVEAALGNGRFLEAYFASGIVGGLLQTALGFVFPAYFGQWVVGASAGVFGIITLFALMEPNRVIMLWFVVPVRALYFVYGALFITLFFILVPSNSGVAHAAHLGGILAAMGYLKWFVQADRRLIGWRRFGAPKEEPELVGATTSKRSFWRRSENNTLDDMPAEEFISREVDPILDKISSQGIHSLTSRERKILEAARKKMARRK
jgi:membrane associated rhomboid family serine protease